MRRVDLDLDTTAPDSVLVVENDAELVEFLRQCVAEAGCSCTLTTDIDGALSSLEAQAASPSLIILDLQVSEPGALVFLERLQRDRETAHIPVLMVSDPSDSAQEARAFDLGATDCVGKSVDRRELVARIGSHVRRSRAVQRWRQGTVIDGLTGLLNRRGLGRQLEHEVERAQRNREALAVGFLDLDRFKLVNDTFGHHAGDDLLRDVASIMEDTLRGCDVAGRWGGDEFVVVLPGADPGASARAIERISRQITCLSVAGQPAGLELSAGIVSLEEVAAIGPQTAQNLIDAADQEMYRIKSERINGRYSLRKEPSLRFSSSARRVTPAADPGAPSAAVRSERLSPTLDATELPASSAGMYQIWGGKGEDLASEPGFGCWPMRFVSCGSDRAASGAYS